MEAATQRFPENIIRKSMRWFLQKQKKQRNDVQKWKQPPRGFMKMAVLIRWENPLEKICDSA